MNSLTPIIEAQALKETESALRELVQVSINCGISRAQMAMMLKSIAEDYEPRVLN
jgi:DNA-binding transcriptional regulator YhcF (GntR family)